MFERLNAFAAADQAECLLPEGVSGYEAGRFDGTLETNFVVGKHWETGWRGLTNTLVVSRSDYELAKLLRSESYREIGMVVPREIIGDQFDEATNSRIFLLRENGRAAGTIRVLIHHPRYKLPTAFGSRFEREIAMHVGGCNYVEISRFGIVHHESVRTVRYALALMQNVSAEADHNVSRYILAPVRREHLAFYSAMGFKMISEFRLFPGWPAEVTLACLDWPRERERLRYDRRFQHLFSARNLERRVSDARREPNMPRQIDKR